MPLELAHSATTARPRLLFPFYSATESSSSYDRKHGYGNLLGHGLPVLQERRKGSPDFLSPQALRIFRDPSAAELDEDEDCNGKNACVVEECPPKNELQELMKGRWAAFFPQRPLKVLLVEEDKSTRIAVTDLLQSCSYEVTTAENGLEAWELMNSGVHEFDLVLADVILPILSGTCLLARITRSDAHRDTPVIMISSHDSSDLVFKCLLRGAKDFLVKPLRKNELKNLWQHVWRKCLRKSMMGKKNTNTGETKSSSEMCNLGMEGSYESVDVGGQSSDKNAWYGHTRRQIQPLNKNLGDLTSPVENTSNNLTHASLTSSKDRKTEGEFLYKQGTPMPDDVDSCHQTSHGMSSAKKPEHIHGEVAYMDSKCSVPGYRTENAIDLIGVVACQSKYEHSEWENDVEERTSGAGCVKPKRMRTSAVNSNCVPMLELTLKRSYSIEDQYLQEDANRNLRWSINSAFSRYSGFGAPSFMDGVSLSDQISPHGNSGVQLACKGDGAATACNESLRVLNFQPNGIHPGLFHKSSSFASMCGKDNSPPFQDATFLKLRSPASERPSSGAFSPQNVHSHDSVQAGTVLSNKDQENISEARNRDQSNKSFLNGETHANESPVEKDGDIGNSTNTGNTSGSNEGSNEDLLTHTPNTTRNSLEDGPCTEGQSVRWSYDKMVMTGGDVTANGLVTDQVRNAHREAALDKFRQKRKFRCFEKKVRYQSRKKLAEQRPRVKGQFVRQAVYEATIQEKKVE